MSIVEKIEVSATCYCPGCGKALGKPDMDGGRCTAVGCGTMLTSIVIAELPKWSVNTPTGSLVVRAENKLVLQQALKDLHITVDEPQIA